MRSQLWARAAGPAQAFPPGHSSFAWTRSVAKLPGLERVLGGMLDPIGLYNQQMEVIDAFPFPESGREARVIISPIRTAVDLSAALRITAPRGYQWAVTQEDMEIAIGSTEELPGDSYQWRHGTHGRG